MPKKDEQKDMQPWQIGSGNVFEGKDCTIASCQYGSRFLVRKIGQKVY